MAERRAPTTTKVAGMIQTHKDDANAHHTPGGGGGGADVKAGIDTTIDSQTWGTITFATAFSSVPTVSVAFAIVTTGVQLKNWFIRNVTASSFEVYYQEKNGNRCDVHWIAMEVSNP